MNQRRSARRGLYYVWWILGGVRPIAGVYLLANLAGIAHMAMALLTPLLIREVVLELEGRPSLGIVPAVALLGLLAVAGAIARYGVVYLPHRVAYEYLQLMRVTVFDHLQRLHHGYFGRERTGDLMSTLLSDVEALEHFVAHAFPTTVKHVVVATLMALILAILDWRMALVALALLPLSLGVMFLTSGISRRRYRRHRHLLGDLNATLQESIVGLPVLKSFVREREQISKVRAKASGVQDAIASQLVVRDLPVTATEIGSGLATALTLAVGSAFVLAGELALGDLFVFVLYTLAFYRPFLELTTVTDRLQDSITGAERLHALLETRPEIVDAPGAVAPTSPRWSVELRDVAFGYEPGSPVLREVSFAVQEGEVAALVGPSGVGKSTVAALVARFYDPRGGQVLVGGQDVRSLPVSFLRENVAMVLQDVFLFDDTIAENIRFGRLDATRAEIEAAARAANIHDLTTSLPQGYDTRVGERGHRLSGGEKQRIAIARALLKDAPILVLDEATSSVDIEGEHLIQQAIARLTLGRTVIVIAHRLSTIRAADRIIVLGDGRVAEQGGHEELIAHDGFYAAMYRLQQVAGEWEIGSPERAVAPD